MRWKQDENGGLGRRRKTFEKNFEGFQEQGRKEGGCRLNCPRKKSPQKLEAIEKRPECFRPVALPFRAAGSPLPSVPPQCKPGRPTDAPLVGVGRPAVAVLRRCQAPSANGLPGGRGGGLQVPPRGNNAFAVRPRVLAGVSVVLRDKRSKLSESKDALGGLG